MDSQPLEARIEEFKKRVDDDGEFLHLPLGEFIEQIALTQNEKREAKRLLLELQTKS
jgi:hypothetical protein